MNSLAATDAVPENATSGFRFGELGSGERAALRARFLGAEPFPHLALDDFLLVPPERIVAAFPADDWPHWDRFRDAYQRQKRACSEIEAFPVLLRELVRELSAPSFLAFLEEVTGIEGLLPDPYLVGGGLHCSGPGGILAPHADFHAYGRLALYRRINVLVYLNPEWREDWGGSLELFRKGEDRPTTAITPLYGRMAMFLTDDRSIHGFTRPIAAGKWRRSLALYYYTSADTSRFSGDGVTYWQAHGQQRGLALARLICYKLLLRGSWMLSKSAHYFNPNFKRSER